MRWLQLHRYVTRDLSLVLHVSFTDVARNPSVVENVPSRQERASRARNDVGVTPYSAWKEREKYDTLLNPTA